MRDIFVLQHVAREDTDDENVKLIGVYSSEDAAKEAVSRLSGKPGFVDCPLGFHIDRYQIDKDNWTEGFVS
jgi:hypothetical protein